MDIMLIVGFSSLVLWAFFIYRTYKEVQSLGAGRTLTKSKLAFFYCFSIVYVIVSFLLFAYVTYRVILIGEFDEIATLLMALGSYLLTVGIGTLIYYSQLMDSKRDGKQIDRIETAINQLTMDSKRNSEQIDRIEAAINQLNISIKEVAVSIEAQSFAKDKTKVK